MPESITIKVEFSPFREEKLKIPSETRIPSGTMVRWEIDFNKYIKFLPERLYFQLYFVDKSPFEWMNSGLYLESMRRLVLRSPKGLLLAESIAMEKGDYKYGIKVTDTITKEVLEDVDPFLIVF